MHSVQAGTAKGQDRRLREICMDVLRTSKRNERVSTKPEASTWEGVKVVGGKEAGRQGGLEQERQIEDAQPRAFGRTHSYVWAWHGMESFIEGTGTVVAAPSGANHLVSLPLNWRTYDRRLPCGGPGFGAAISSNQARGTAPLPRPGSLRTRHGSASYP